MSVVVILSTHLVHALTGELTAEVRGPTGKIPVTIDARNDGKHTVVFTPREEGTRDFYNTSVLTVEMTIYSCSKGR